MFNLNAFYNKSDLPENNVEKEFKWNSPRIFAITVSDASETEIMPYTFNV